MAGRAEHLLRDPLLNEIRELTEKALVDTMANLDLGRRENQDRGLELIRQLQSGRAISKALWATLGAGTLEERRQEAANATIRRVDDPRWMNDGRSREPDAGSGG